MLAVSTLVCASAGAAMIATLASPAVMVFRMYMCCPFKGGVREPESEPDPYAGDEGEGFGVLAAGAGIVCRLTG